MPILLRSKAAHAWIQLSGVAREAKRGPPFSPVRFDLDCQPTAWHLFPSSVCVPSRLPLLAIVTSQRVTTLCEGRQGPSEVIPYSKIAAPASAAAMAQTSFAQHCNQNLVCVMMLKTKRPMQESRLTVGTPSTKRPIGTSMTPSTRPLQFGCS